MTRNYVLTSSTRQTSTSGGDQRRRVRLRGLLALPIALLLAIAPAAGASAAGTTGSEGLSGYKHTESAKKETVPAKTTKEAEPTKAVEPATTSEPATTTEPEAKAKTLPFTGYDLSWTVGFGVLLVGAGGSIVLTQRRRRGANR
ncbi:MAG TPA: hypothetical protein VMG80_00125 [Solirubrobacteraceae bacterium]|nr:hypothetical protein [Solirubrobacteraceae bacterium]